VIQLIVAFEGRALAQSSQIIFGNFRLDTSRQSLLRDGETVSLSPKALAVLSYLATRPGRMVSKEELLEAVWPDTYITDAVLKVRMLEIRRALNDDAGQPRFIETAHRRGYRFIASVASTNLPVPISSFIGREREIGEIKRSMANVRLLTIRGPGGSGKTRLALQVARESAQDYPDGVWWVSLTSVSSADMLPQAIAVALGVREQPGRAMLQTLIHHLRNLELLLVIDNCEHLAAACAAVSDVLLTKAAGLKIMTTSRQALGVSGEAIWLAPPLSLPEADLQDLDQPENYEAIRLFCDRARELVPNFVLSPANSTAIADICRRLDGLPLAIELAAARVEVLSVDEIAGRLGDCFSLLTGIGRREVPRHETLRAAIDWSHELLPDKEKILLRRLAIFAGSFNLAALETVCTGSALRASEILDFLAQLVRKSLVLPLATGSSASTSTRYRLLETIRQYGLEKLSQAEELDDLSLRHAEFFLNIAEKAEPNINSSQRKNVMQQLESDLDNFRAVLDWSCSHSGRGELPARMAAALWWFWFHRGFWSEARQRLQRVLAIANGDHVGRCKALRAAGMLFWFQGDHATACLHLRSAIDIAGRLGETRLLASSMDFLGQALADMGHLSQATPLAEESVVLLEGSGSWELAIALIDLGNIKRFRGEHLPAISLYEKSVALLRDLNENWALGMALRNLGISAFQSGEPERAKRLLGESLSVLRGMEEKWFVSRSLEELATVLSTEGKARVSATLFGASEILREIVGASVLQVHRSKYDASVAAVRAELGDEEFRSAWGEGRAMQYDEAVGYALDTIGMRSA
jgi:non-specific serine/threonine protein kinase